MGLSIGLHRAARPAGRRTIGERMASGGFFRRRFGQRGLAAATHPQMHQRAESGGLRHLGRPMLLADESESGHLGAGRAKPNASPVFQVGCFTTFIHAISHPVDPDNRRRSMIKKHGAVPACDLIVPAVCAESCQKTIKCCEIGVKVCRK